MLRHRRDSTVYQDMSVIDILNAVLKDGAGEGDYTPAWQFNLADSSIYPKRSLTTQYNETDLGFVNRARTPSSSPTITPPSAPTRKPTSATPRPAPS